MKKSCCWWMLYNMTGTSMFNSNSTLTNTFHPSADQPRRTRTRLTFHLFPLSLPATIPSANPCNHFITSLDPKLRHGPRKEQTTKSRNGPRAQGDERAETSATCGWGESQGGQCTPCFVRGFALWCVLTPIVKGNDIAGSCWITILDACQSASNLRPHHLQFCFDVG